MNELRKSYRPWAVLIACCFVDMIGITVPVTIFSVFLTPIRTGLGLTMFQAQSYNMAMMLTTIVSTALGARLLKMGVGKLIAIASAAIMVGYWSIGLAPSVGTLVFAGILSGFYPLVSFYTLPIVVSNWFYERQGTWISICIAMSGVGGFVLSPVATALIASMGWQTAMMAIGSCMLIPLVLGAGVVRMSPLPYGILPWGASPEQAQAQLEEGSAAEGKGGDAELPGATFKQALHNPGFVFLAIVMFCMGFQNCYVTNLNPLVQSSGYSAAIAAMALSATSLGNLLGKPIWGVLRDRWGAFMGGSCAWVTMICGLCLYIVGMTVYTEPVMIIAGFIGGLGGTAALNMPSLYTKDAFGARDFSRIYSAQVAVRSVGSAAVYPLVGIMYDATGGYLMMVLCVIAAAVIPIPAGYLAVKLGRRTWLPGVPVVGRPVDVALDEGAGADEPASKAGANQHKGASAERAA